MKLEYENPQLKTLSALTRQALANRIKDDIDAFCVKELTDERRKHLGASVIGDKCNAKSWYAFRWAKLPDFDGRMLRLFNRGHLEEPRAIRWLRGIGCQVWEVDPTTKKQFRIYGFRGHFGGAMDAQGITPYFPDLPMLGEFKTYNDKQFTKLIKTRSVALTKPEHFRQMCCYGRDYGFKYALYYATNKNDDEIYIEIVELSVPEADRMATISQEVISAKQRPPRIAESEIFFDCKYCDFAGICHRGEPVNINCRSCKMAEPIDGGQWYCHRHLAVIPDDVILTGCGDHNAIT